MCPSVTYRMAVMRMCSTGSENARQRAADGFAGDRTRTRYTVDRRLTRARCQVTATHHHTLMPRRPAVAARAVYPMSQLLNTIRDDFRGIPPWRASLRPHSPPPPRLGHTRHTRLSTRSPPHQHPPLPASFPAVEPPPAHGIVNICRRGLAERGIFLQHGFSRPSSSSPPLGMVRLCQPTRSSDDSFNRDDGLTNRLALRRTRRIAAYNIMSSDIFSDSETSFANDLRHLDSERSSETERRLTSGEMSSSSVDSDSCGSGPGRDDGDDAKRSSSAKRRNANFDRRSHSSTANETSLSSPSSRHHHHQQQQQQQVHLSPRSREYLRLRVNARERQRMHDMNVALDALRRAMPYAQGPAVKKLSKMNTLLLARNYILLLTRTLDELRRLLVAVQPRLSAGDLAPSDGGLTRSGSGDQAAALEAALRGLIDGREINAEQQRFTEELIRREQLQQHQSHDEISLSGRSTTAPFKPVGSSDARKRFSTASEDSEDRQPRRPSESPSVLAPDALLSNRKRKLQRDDDDRKAKQPFEEKNTLLPYALVPPSAILMKSPYLPEMPPLVGIAAQQHQQGHASAATAAAMMSHVISGPHPSCPCRHCAQARPTYIVPLDVMAAAAVSHYHHQQHPLCRL